MFEKVGLMHVRSSWGFEVKWWRRATQIYVEYRDGDHVMHFDNTQNATALGYPLFSIMPKLCPTTCNTGYHRLRMRE